MPDKALFQPARIEQGLRLIARLPDILVALNDDEYEAATIFGFDPEAMLPAGALAALPDRSREPTVCLPGDRLDFAGWRRLARACIASADAIDANTCLAAFLAERIVPEHGDGVVLPIHNGTHEVPADDRRHP